MSVHLPHAVDILCRDRVGFANIYVFVSSFIVFFFVTAYKMLTLKVSSPLPGGSLGYSILPDHPGVHHWERHSDLDYPRSQAHEDCDQLLHRQPGFL